MDFDAFTKKADVEVLKNKNSSTVQREHLITWVVNLKVYVDEGTEFRVVNQELFDWMKENNSNHYLFTRSVCRMVQWNNKGDHGVVSTIT